MSAKGVVGVCWVVYLGEGLVFVDTYRRATAECEGGKGV